MFVNFSNIITAGYVINDPTIAMPLSEFQPVGSTFSLNLTYTTGYSTTFSIPMMVSCCPSASFGCDNVTVLFNYSSL